MAGKIIIVVWLVVLALAPFPLAYAQQPKKVPRIGVISPAFPSAAAPFIEAFREGLLDLGYIEGKNIVVEARYGEGKEDRLPALAAELVHLRVDIIVAGGGNATLAAKNATKTIPIVMASASDPVGSGLVASLARPGGNITGSTLINSDLSGKRLELLKETIPKLTHVVVLLYRDNPAATLMLKETQSAAQSLGLQLQILEVHGSDDFENVFGVAKKGHSGAINVLSSAFFGAQREKDRGIGFKDATAGDVLQ